MFHQSSHQSNLIGLEAKLVNASGKIVGVNMGAIIARIECRQMYDLDLPTCVIE